MYIVSVRKSKGIAVIQVEFEGHILRFPLTKKSCIGLGQYMFERGQHSWLYSSTIDYPKEVKPSFRYDIRELMMEGYKKAYGDFSGVQEKRIGDYEIRGNKYVSIAINVKNPKDSHCFDINPDVGNDNAFIRACSWFED
jgi:hypothetical protein